MICGRGIRPSRVLLKKKSPWGGRCQQDPARVAAYSEQCLELMLPLGSFPFIFSLLTRVRRLHVCSSILMRVKPTVARPQTLRHKRRRCNHTLTMARMVSTSPFVLGTSFAATSNVSAPPQTPAIGGRHSRCGGRQHIRYLVLTSVMNYSPERSAGLRLCTIDLWHVYADLRDCVSLYSFTCGKLRTSL